jgi:hypothetical protein
MSLACGARHMRRRPDGQDHADQLSSAAHPVERAKPKTGRKAPLIGEPTRL